MATASTNSATKTSFRQAVHKWRVLENEISSANKNITSKVADELINSIDTRYETFITQHQNDHQKRDKHIYKSRTDDGYRVNVVGSQVLYDEFGTGDPGVLHPHPEKNRYGNLKPYLSGEYIKYSPRSGHYWTFKDGNTRVWTHGVEPGLFVYNSFRDISEGIAANIAIDELIKAAKKAVKGK